MGNCQAVDAAALVIQHPSGKQERMYWPVTASEVMKTNPGHYVSLIIPLPVSGENPPPAISGENPDDSKTVRYTRVKLLRPHDTLVLGRAYRLVTTQEVMKVLKAKKHAKMKKKEPEPGENLQWRPGKPGSSQTAEKNNLVTRQERRQHRSGQTNISQGRPRSWQPSLQSISESGS